jgi:hypothetical protein
MSNSGINRRDLIKWGTFVGAALGLPSWKVLECLDHTVGKAYGAVNAPQTLPTIVGMAPNGGLAHYTQVWGTTASVAAKQGNTPIHMPGTPVPLAAGSKGGAMFGTPLYPFRDIPGLKNQATTIVCGRDTTHSGVQQMFGQYQFAANVYWPALVTVAQSADSFTLPQIAIGNNALVGTATDQRPTARAASADAFSLLFTKQLSSTGKALDPTKAGVNSPMFKASFTTFSRLLYASGVAKSRVDYQTTATLNSGKTGTEVLAQNLGDLLKPTLDELTLYGVNTQGVDNSLVNLAKSLITFRKAVGRNLTGSLLVQAAPGNDPHGADPAGGGTPESKVTWNTLSKIWKQFTTDMLADGLDFLATIAGDTTKSVTTSDGWGDGLSGGGTNHSMMFVMDTTGRVSDGIFGDFGPGVTNRAMSFNPTTGAPDVNVQGMNAANVVMSGLISSICRKNSAMPAIAGLNVQEGFLRPRIET